MDFPAENREPRIDASVRMPSHNRAKLQEKKARKAGWNGNKTKEEKSIEAEALDFKDLE